MLGIQLPEVQSKQDSGLFGYTNPLTGSNHIYTREEVGSMSIDEYAKHEKEIDAQTKYFNGSMPTNGDLQREALTNGGVVYVNSYIGADQDFSEKKFLLKKEEFFFALYKLLFIQSSNAR